MRRYTPDITPDSLSGAILAAEGIRDTRFGASLPAEQIVRFQQLAIMYIVPQQSFLHTNFEPIYPVLLINCFKLLGVSKASAGELFLLNCFQWIPHMQVMFF